MRNPGKGGPEGQPQTQGFRRRTAPVTYDKEALKRSTVAERSFNTLKQWRSLATRYAKLAPTYRSAAVLHAVVIRGALLGDMS